jgi:hypothetical protein
MKRSRSRGFLFPCGLRADCAGGFGALYVWLVSRSFSRAGAVMEFLGTLSF